MSDKKQNSCKLLRLPTVNMELNTQELMSNHLTNKECVRLVKGAYPDCKIHKGINDLILLSHPKKGIHLANGSNPTKLYRVAAESLIAKK